MAGKKARGRSAQQLRDEALEGFRRLALGAGNDALKLLFYDGQLPEDELRGLDIFNVSNIKRGNSGVEIKFYDRLEALTRLEALCSADESSGGLQAFYEALQRPAEGGWEAQLTMDN